jgi:hypothetical protein
VPPGEGWSTEPTEIFELILKADELLKYATEDKAAVRAGQARELLDEARREAGAIGNDQLVEQAERRLADLATMPGDTPDG